MDPHAIASASFWTIIPALFAALVCFGISVQPNARNQTSWSRAAVLFVAVALVLAVVGIWTRVM